jgi:hypothetical protein
MRSGAVLASLAIMILLAILTFVFGSGSASADAIDQPPACPPGARGVSSHAGLRCHPAACTSDADCEGRGVCRPWRVCTIRSSVPPGGLGGFNQPPRDEELVVGSCEPSAQCRGDEEPPPPMVGTPVAGPPVCRDASYCVPERGLPPLPESPAGQSASSSGSGEAATSSTSQPSRNGCGCEAAPGAAVLSGLWLLFFARRRR